MAGKRATRTHAGARAGEVGPAPIVAELAPDCRTPPLGGRGRVAPEVAPADRLTAALSGAEVSDDVAMERARSYNGNVVQLRDRLMVLALAATERTMACLDAETDPAKLIHIAARASEVSRGLAMDSATRLEVTRAVSSGGAEPPVDMMRATLSRILGVGQEKAPPG